MANREAPVSVDNLHVELKPHKGYRRSRGLVVEVDLGQDVIFINGVWSGYVAHGPNAQINLLHSGLPADLMAAIKTKVDEIRGQATRRITETKQLQENNVVVETEESLEDENI